MFTEAQNFSLVQTELDEVFSQNYENSIVPSHATAMTSEIFKITETSHAAYIGTIHKGPGLFSKIGETQSVPSTIAKAGNKWTVTMSDFSAGIEISKNLFDDDIHGEWNTQVAEFAIMARKTQDFNAFKIFRGAFTTTLTADGIALVSASHLTLSGAIVSNLVTSTDVGAATSALTTSAFNVAMRRLAEMPSQAGVPLLCVGDVLVVAPALYVAARQIATSALVPETSTNATNIFTMDYSVKVYQAVFMGASQGGSDTAWFLLDSKKHAIRRYVRQGIQTALSPWQESRNRTYFYQANFREEVFCPDYVGVVGATGL